MEDLKLTIKFSNVIPFPTQEVTKQKINEAQQMALDIERDLDAQMDIIMQKAEEVEQLSADLLRLAEDMIKNPGKYE
jgi:hypothetical protein